MTFFVSASSREIKPDLVDALYDVEHGSWSSNALRNYKLAYDIERSNEMHRSASARPYADRMELYRCMRMVLIPSSRAISHACWPPAPPKQASLSGSHVSGAKEGWKEGMYICFDVANPRDSVKARMGRHMVSFATLINLGVPQ